MTYAYLDKHDNLDPHLDINCQKLADYLKSGLNYAIARQIPNGIACRDTRSFDDVNFALSCLPLLKVYRQSETTQRSQIVDTNLAITYAMGHPDVQKLPGIMHWVDRVLTAQIAHIAANDRGCGWWLLPKSEPIKSEYRIMANELMQPVYVYLKLSLTAREIC
ncbi:hypothetical protein [Chamaesiphon sp. OTE_8_metabat_110]|uniref:hypothetical protein n=1 Tax=Chamaesiphon sp. OTE_8_metabat_110 TaxID=2964696 RepID=UPI00286BF39C|nr:hypothetical protein [Chamaesiphon sp. OTE_8_metabat_110]